MNNSSLGYRTSKLIFFSTSLPETVIYEVDSLETELPSGQYTFIVTCWNVKEQNKYYLVVK